MDELKNRQYYLCTNLSWLENKDEWPGLKAVAMAREERTVNGKTSTDVRFFLTSLDNIELVKKSIRLHWGIENRLHWCLDMTFNEGLQKGTERIIVRKNMTVMRRLALNILRQAEKPENKKQDSLSKRTIWFRENRQFRQTVLRLL
ncbi:MAG: ISAs1 family transposase [Treponema succinifaciens]|nr:MAG: ISAs1 family transposase [Treponema succinifaciens]